MSRRMMNLEAMKSVISKVWKLSSGLLIREMGEKMFLFHFDNIKEKDRVLLMQPWAYNKALLVLDEFDGLSLPAKMAKFVLDPNSWITPRLDE
ncbi:hypothetical protein REPUB_Repub05bG0000200 [Reevesia pubescens]